jgi:error-prone DNA polymerase
MCSEWLSTLENHANPSERVVDDSTKSSSRFDSAQRPESNYPVTERSRSVLFAADNVCVDNKPILRLGLHLISGLSEQAAQRLVAARLQRPFTDAQDLALRAKLSTRELEALAAADALHNLAGNRHQAAWTLAGVDTQLSLFAEQPFQEATPLLPVPTEGQNILADYHSLGLSLRRHPLALLRDRCLRRHIVTAAQLQQAVHDTQVRVAGLVLSRQSPGTAKNTTFITLEDETGQINLIVWSNVAQRYRQAFLASQLLEVTGRLQHQSGVIHVVAESMIDRSQWIGALQVRARDFH